MTLNPEVLEATENAFAPQLSDDMKAHLHRAVERAVAVADLLEHRELNEALVKRNEARGEAEELGKKLAARQEAAEHALSEIEFRIKPETGEPFIRLKDTGSLGYGHRRLDEVLTDTTKAAALYQRVPKGYVAVPFSAVHGAVELGRDFYKGIGTSPCLYPDWLRELGVCVDNMLAHAAKPQASEGAE